MCTSRFTVSSCVARHRGLKIPDHAPRTSCESHTIHISNPWPISGARSRAASVGIEPIGASLCLSARCGYVPLPRANSCAPDGLRGDDGGVGSLRVPLPRHVRRRMLGGRVQQLATKLRARNPPRWHKQYRTSEKHSKTRVLGSDQKH